jgi:hypothetical protein
MKIVRTEKYCAGCKDIRPIELFGPKATRSYCRPCWAAYVYRLRASKREYYRALVRKNWNKHKDKYNLKRYELLLNEQNGVCKICLEKESSRRYKTLAVDHCHRTNKVRGLLCSNCNRGLGLFKDNPKILNNAAAYLTKAMEKN